MSDGRAFHIYCDESRTAQDRFMVFGGIIVESLAMPTLEQRIGNFRTTHNMHAEMKWTKVSDAKLPQYAEFVNEFFRLCSMHLIHFRSLVLDTSLIDYRKYHAGDKELGFYKFFYQLLLHGFAPYANNRDRVHIVFDQRRSKYSLDDLKGILNKGIRKKYGHTSDVVASIQPICSKSCNAIQLADVLMGAIGFQCNDRHLRVGARNAKIALAEHVARMARLNSLKNTTPMRSKHFGIWRFTLQAQPQKKVP